MRRQKRPSEKFSDGLSGIGKPLIFRLRRIPFFDDVAVGVNRDVAGMGGGGLRGGVRRRRGLLRFGLLRFFLFFLVFFLFVFAVGDGGVNHGTGAFYGQFASGNDRRCGQIDCGTDDAAAQNEAGG